MHSDRPAPPDWAQVRATLERALELTDDAARAALLADPALPPGVAEEVRSLLAHHAAGTGGFLAEPAARPAPERDRSGERLGAWRVVRRLGSGGMGDVWLAERADGAWQGAAAVKVLRRGMDSDAVLARFALEQQALARLRHPHIAHLIDAGRTADGLPFFVMEHVEGRPIDQAAAGLPLPARLQLFLQLADAVAHAHRNLLVHRDLKPGNVLVTAEGQVKLLDFGIAKALDPGADDPAERTRLGERPFTPQYASPEQVRGEPVTTATDVYSMGVLLYVMLTGRRPLGRDTAEAMATARAVLDEPPTRPSALPAPVADAASDWPAVRRQLRGDLDNILLKALEKEPARRYASIDAFANDVRAHLSGHPVSARAPSPAYLASRFVRRHAAAVAVGVLASAGLVATAAVAAWQAREAEAQRAVAEERFRQVRQLANQLVFKYHDQIENLPGATQAREALLTDAAAFLDGLARTGGDDSSLSEEFANTYYRISRLQGVDASINTGQHGAAEANLDKAIALTRRYVERPGTSVQALASAISMHVSKGELWQRSGRMTEADAALREGLPLLERALAIDPRDSWALASAITLHGVRARLLGSSLAGATLGRWREACDSADRARAAADATLAADPENRYGPDSLAFTLGEQAQCRYLTARFDEAAELHRRQVALRDLMAVRFADDMDFRYQRAVARGQMARALSALGRHAEARETVTAALAMARAAAAADAGNAASATRIEALELIRLQVLLAAGDSEAARREAAALLERQPRERAPSFTALRARAEALLWAARAWRPARPESAEALAAQAVTLLAPARDGDDNATRQWMLAQALGERAFALEAAGRRDAATEVARDALQAWLRKPPPDGPPPLHAPTLQVLTALARAPATLQRTGAVR